MGLVERRCFRDYRLRKRILFAAMIIVFVISVISAAGLMPGATGLEIMEWSADRTMAAHYDMCKEALEGSFDEMGYDRRLEFFEAAVDIESNYLCIPYRIEVRTDDLEEGIAANFSYTDRTITINNSYLKNCGDAWDLVTTASHEVYHAWQYEACRLDEVVSDERARAFLYDELMNVEEYREEFSNYENEGIEYYMQTVERDARRYARNSVEMWKERMQELAEEMR